MAVNTNVVCEVIRDGANPETFETFSTAAVGLTLPLTLPFTLPKAGIVRKAFDLQRYDRSREMQFQLSTPGGKLVLRSISASAFIDTMEVQS